MQIKMYFFVKNIVLLFLFTPNDPENGKITCHNHLHYVHITFTLRSHPVRARKMSVPFRLRFESVPVP